MPHDAESINECLLLHRHTYRRYIVALVGTYSQRSAERINCLKEEIVELVLTSYFYTFCTFFDTFSMQPENLYQWRGSRRAGSAALTSRRRRRRRHRAASTANLRPCTPLCKQPPIPHCYEGGGASRTHADPPRRPRTALTFLGRDKR